MPCGDEDITCFISQETLQDHMIKESCDFLEGSSSLCVNSLLDLVAKFIAIVEKKHI